ncbi:MAG: hypothetical protein IGS38_07785 [Synechococcales cyanobacterium M58_A2018_015]|nr:hypothetical protein [Synechococcales cyanobacterium M58_A2018_015]
MLSWFSLQVARQVTRIASSLQRPIRISLLMLLLATFCSGCTQIEIPQRLLSSRRQSNVDFAVQVTAAETPGVYRVSGQADLPNRTQLTVAAVRYLYPEAPAVATGAEPTYAILDYRLVQVERGEWNTQLNLWKVAADGRYQEEWQIDQQRLGLQWQPDDNVVFLATLTPIERLAKLEQQLARRGRRFASGTVLSTAEGQRYAQAHQLLSVALPTGSTTPPPPRPEAHNYGWGDRYLIPQEPQNPTQLQRPAERITTAPRRPEELLR